MVGAQVGVILGPSEGLDPDGSALMLLGSVGSRNLAVGNVAHERVQEGILGVSLDRRASLAADEFPALEVMQRLLERPSAILPTDRPDGSEPEDLADDSCILEQCLLLSAQRIQTRGDQTLDGFGKRQVAVPGRSRDPGELFSVERVPAGALEQSGLDLSGKHRAVEQAVQQL